MYTFFPYRLPWMPSKSFPARVYGNLLTALLVDMVLLSFKGPLLYMLATTFIRSLHLVVDPVWVIVE